MNKGQEMKRVRAVALEAAGKAIDMLAERGIVAQCGVPLSACLRRLERATWRWSSRMTRTMGTAVSSVFRLEIALSWPLWERASEAERDNTAVHELMHCLAWLVWGSGVSHDRRWRSLMLAAGYSAERCHEVSTKGLRPNRVTAFCGCTEHEITKRRAEQLQRGAVSMYCRKCQHTIALDKAAVKPRETYTVKRRRRPQLSADLRRALRQYGGDKHGAW